jgi:L-lactate dehydrogenase complex protein LldE
MQLLEKLGCEVRFPLDQTCCGQPMANSGFASLSKGCDANFVKNFKGFDHIVAPSGSCVLHIKEHLHDEKNLLVAEKIKKSVYELTEFLVDILKVTHLEASFPFKVGLHNSCHGQRMLGISSMSERVLPEFSKPEQLLQMVKGIQLIRPERNDECCGFGGTFCVFEEAVSVKMGKDRIKQHQANEVDYITGVDSSCLMHMEGILNRQGNKMKTIHIAEILNSNM